MQFYIESEIFRRTRAPTFHHSFGWNRVEGRIHLHHFEMSRVPSESFVRRHFLWIPTLDEPRIRPTRGANENPASVLLSFAPVAHPKQKRLSSNERKSRL